jgi:hypothetical protein
MASVDTNLPARTAPRQLFLSYARPDRPRAERLAAALEAAGNRVWWDAALEGGHRFAAEIERALHAADAVVVIWSADSVTSNWVLDEAMHGRDRGCLIPVRFDDTPPPLGFRQLQTIDLEDRIAPDGIEAIGRAAARVAGEALPSAPPAGTKARRAAATTRSGKPLWYPFAWAGFGLVVWLISWALYQN